MTTTSFASSFDNFFTGSKPGFVSQFAARLLQPWTLFCNPVPDPQRVAWLAQTVASQPQLRTWIAAIAGKNARVQRALLTRSAQIMRCELGNAEAAEVLEQLTDAALLRAVVESLSR